LAIGLEAGGAGRAGPGAEFGGIYPARPRRGCAIRETGDSDGERCGIDVLAGHGFSLGGARRGDGDRFVWTADPDAIIEKVRRGKQVLESIH